MEKNLELNPGSLVKSEFNEILVPLLQDSSKEQQCDSSDFEGSKPKTRRKRKSGDNGGEIESDNRPKTRKRKSIKKPAPKSLVEPQTLKNYDLVFHV